MDSNDANTTDDGNTTESFDTQVTVPLCSDIMDHINLTISLYLLPVSVRPYHTLFTHTHTLAFWHIY
jgi:hypothetical protein